MIDLILSKTGEYVYHVSECDMQGLKATEE
jgi:hypothetical protein